MTTMHEALALLNRHASVRHFTRQEISEDDEMTILMTAQRAPTSSNLHAYAVIGVRDQEKKDRLAELCGGQDHIAACSLFLVFCGDMYRLKRLAEQRGYNFNGDTVESLLIATVDASLVADRALIAAQALGLGGVMVGGIRNHPEEVCSLLQIPEYAYPVMGMSLGYPASEPKIKPRLPIEAVYFRESYNAEQMDKPIADYDETIAALGYLKGREVEPERYPNFTGQYSWSEHSARRMATDNPGTVRLHLKQFLQQRGLMKR
ncbi:MAG: NADPH-dependent oxidoreductase [Candidatus Zixiibacteriota bacterium]|nr:MAG: NADPH-dependent oxidoreductase [candidate division Zixibacteria bacterium]